MQIYTEKARYVEYVYIQSPIANRMVQEANLYFLFLENKLH